MLHGNARLAFPNNHIEADNRLSWLLGRLDQAYGTETYYVHLKRDLLSTAQSFRERWDRGIMNAYRTEILMGAGKLHPKNEEDKLSYCLDYCETVNSNIELFLQNKPHKMEFRMENAQNDWVRFQEWINAKGDLEGALQEWQVKHNSRASQ